MNGKQILITGATNGVSSRRPKHLPPVTGYLRPDEPPATWWCIGSGLLVV